jgi:3-phosphoshikimate 1-carboxyvinyltransferase
MAISGQSPRACIVEGDWSAAAFLLVGGAIAGRVTVSRVEPTFCASRPRHVIDALQLPGANISWKNEDAITVFKKSPLRAFDFDATHCPDFFPPLAALAACCDGTSTILGTIHRLHHKESDRATTISATLQQLAIEVGLEGRCPAHHRWPVRGQQRVSSFNDHRIAMMAAILGPCGRWRISSSRESKAVNKSYPNFFHDVASLSR